MEAAEVFELAGYGPLGEPFYEVGVLELDGGVVGCDGGGRIAFPFLFALEGVEEGRGDDGGFVEGGFIVEVINHEREAVFDAPFEKPVDFGVYKCKDSGFASEDVSSCILTDFYHIK